MQQTTSSEKQRYLEEFENEYQTTRRLLHAYPEDKADLRPHPKAKTAQELAWMLALNQMVVIPALTAKELTGEGLPQAPGDWKSVLEAFDRGHRETVDKVNGLPDETLNETLRMPVAPKTMGDMRRGKALWFFLGDTIHHRGQFSVYLRMAGAKVPSIYGPSADEPWT